MALWFVINTWPGWWELSLLTAEAIQVVWLVNLSLVVGAGVNLVYAVLDPPWLKAIGEFITTGVALIVLVQAWRVFPFDFRGSSVNWTPVTRVVIVVAIVGTVIGLLVQLGTLVRLAYEDVRDEAVHR